jgi:hypothetical protein
MDVDISVSLEDGRTIWLTEISRHTFEEQGLDSLESDSGLFVVLEDNATGAFDILAKVASVAAGHALMALFAARCH